MGPQPSKDIHETTTEQGHPRLLSLSLQTVFTTTTTPLVDRPLARGPLAHKPRITLVSPYMCWLSSGVSFCWVFSVLGVLVHLMLKIAGG